MASSIEKCSFCYSVVSVPQIGWRLKDSTYAKLCVPCASAFTDGTFCPKYHKGENGWRKCDECERELHCGCIMALHTYELNDLTGVTCKECLAKKSVVVSNVNASSSALSPKNCLLLNDSCSSHYNSTGKLLADPNRLKPNKGDRLKPKQETLEGELEQPQLINSGAVFMFEKKLTPSDCDPKIGRVVMPKFHAQRLYPLPSHQRKKAVAYIDTEGTVWKFIVRWWPNRKSRKYVLDGARQCCLAMQWKAGDTLKFYKKLSDGKMIMHLQKKVCESTSSVIPSVADAPELGTEK